MPLLLWGFTIGQGGCFLRRSFLSENSREKGKDNSFTIVISTMGEQGRRSGENARLPPMCPGFDVRRYMSLLLVLYSAPRGFSPGIPIFLSPQKPTFLNSNSIWTSGPLVMSLSFDVKFTFTCTCHYWSSN